VGADTPLRLRFERGYPLAIGIKKAQNLITGRIADFGPVRADLREPSQGVLPRFCLDLRPSLESGHFDLFDARGVPLRTYDGDSAVYNWSTITAYAIACFQRFGETNDAVWADRFTAQTRKLLESAMPWPAGGIAWRADFPMHGLMPGWISALYQGQAISVLVRAHLLLDDPSYLEAAKRAWLVFQIPVHDGGLAVLFPSSDDLCWEEIPNTRPSRILNGWLRAIWGLADLATLTDSQEVHDLYEQGIESLKKQINRYDVGWWSTYDYPDKQPRRLASLAYHMEHVWILESLADRTGIEQFGSYADRWRDCGDTVSNRCRALVQKIGQRVIYGY
jgi:heparosan-N-sulfate-glucuronate 5-epimerase